MKLALLILLYSVGLFAQSDLSFDRLAVTSGKIFNLDVVQFFCFAKVGSGVADCQDIAPEKWITGPVTLELDLSSLDECPASASMISVYGPARIEWPSSITFKIVGIECEPFLYYQEDGDRYLSVQLLKSGKFSIKQSLVEYAK